MNISQIKKKNCKILMFQPPSPPYMDVGRDWAGGMGTATHSFRKDYGYDGDFIPYLSLFYSTSILEDKNYDVSLLDGQTENLGLEMALKRIQHINPSIIVSVVNLPSLSGDLRLLCEIKRIIPSVLIIAIGTVCKALPMEVLKGQVVDYIVMGNAEITLPDFIANIDNKTEREKTRGIAFYQGDQIHAIPENPRILNLDDLPTLPYHLMPIEKYWTAGFGRSEPFIPLLTSKGCPFKCSYYCPYPFGFGKKVIFKTPQKVVDEISLLYHTYHVKNFLFRDQNFTLNSKHTEAICDGIINKNLKIRWICETRLNLVSESLLRKMKAAGCSQINYGFETGDPALFSEVGKPGITLEIVADTVKFTEAVGIKVLLHTIVGLPGENWDTIKKTVRTLRKWNVKSIGVAIASPYPGTQFYKDMKEKGFLLTQDWSKYTGLEPVIKTDTFTAKDLKKAQRILCQSITYHGLAKKVLLLLHKTFTYLQEGTFFNRFYYKVNMWVRYFFNPNKV